MKCGDKCCGSCCIQPDVPWAKKRCSHGIWSGVPPYYSCVCKKKCHNNKTIKCELCGIKYDVLFDGNDVLYAKIKDEKYAKMILCNNKKCNVYVCFNCKDDDRNGKYYHCSKCGRKEVGVFCKLHLNDKMSCSVDMSGYWRSHHAIS